jgi:hypothetical protein
VPVSLVKASNPPKILAPESTLCGFTVYEGRITHGFVVAILGIVAPTV